MKRDPKKEYELVAKLKFWFGSSPEYFKKNLVFEINPSDNFVYIYKEKK